MSEVGCKEQDFLLVVRSRTQATKFSFSLGPLIHLYTNTELLPAGHKPWNLNLFWVINRREPMKRSWLTVAV
jgi:hypothetical protein